MCSVKLAQAKFSLQHTSTRPQVPPIRLGDVMAEQVKEMGPHFHYMGNVAADNEYYFDLTGTLMVTGDWSA